MKKNFYPKFFLLFIVTLVLPAFYAGAQDCSALQFTCTAFESRCMSTGSITVAATGGSGNYNYKVTGALTTPFTSSSIITGLKPGSYTVIVKDVATGCVTQQANVVVTGSYSDPRFQLTKTDVTCVGNNGTISRSNLQYGLAPFSFSIIAPSPSGVGTANTTGNFSNLPAGEYFVQLQDSCGGQQVRRITIENYSWWFDGVTVTKAGCDSADAVINLRDSRGSVNTSGAAFTGYSYGIVKTAGDTVWHTSNTFRFYLGKKRSTVIVAKDNCGNIHTTVWNQPPNTRPVVNTVSLTSYACSTFAATITGQQNLTAPEYCLYNSSNTLVTCNTTGAFTNIAYGNYCIKVRDLCYDTTITRCFTATHPTPSVNASIGITNRTCSAFTATVTGQRNITNAQYCLFNAANVQVVCNASGVFTNVPYGTHTIKIRDGCVDTTIIRTFTVNRLRPTLGSAGISNQTCTTFTVTATGGSNLMNPRYCLFNSSGAADTCNTTGIFTNIPNGTYCIRAITSCNDTTNAVCFTGKPSVPSVAIPVQYSNYTCSTFTATITGQSNLTNPQYCIVDTVTNTTVCNTTGVFPNISYGSYCIQVRDGCVDTIINRCFRVNRPVPTLAGSGISNQTCTAFTVAVTGGTHLINPTYCLYNTTGAVVTCNTTGTFTNIPHGTYCIKAITSCGDTSNAVCFTSVPPRPAVGSSVQTSDKACTTFTATVTGQVNLTNPQYCLFNASDVQVSCNATGVFNNIPYGSYCIKVRGGCNDTTITRCFSEAQAMPAVNATMQQSNNACSTFSARVVGTNLTAPQYCLYNNSNVQVGCNITGVFDNVPYGSYCVTVDDGCIDTIIRICQTFTNPRNFSVSTSKSCTIGSAALHVQFQNSIGPYTVTIYHPDGSIVYSDTTSSPAMQALLPYIPANQRYKIVGGDGCGYKDSILIVPDATVVTKTITSNAKCPSATWENGSGDLSVTCTSNYQPLYPAIIKKNGFVFNRNYSSYTGNNFVFSDLEPATYILEYTMQNCNTTLYDTFALQPYAFPNQDRSAIYQCDNNSFSLGASVTGGVGPYTYQIIGSSPDAPSITAMQINNPLFSINNGTTYSLIRLRTVDACGNATLNDVSVLPLQNIIIRATSTCLYDNIVLSVDSIPNATYRWYRKQNSGDSTLVGDSTQFNIPFFRPEDIGTYICKVNVNNQCLVRVAYFNLTGDCGQHTLPVAIKLTGKKVQHGNVLNWTVSTEKEIGAYIIERKEEKTGSFKVLGSLPAHQRLYQFTDAHPEEGSNYYRLKIVHKGGRINYSNTIHIREQAVVATIYPNPVSDVLTVSIAGKKTASYRIELGNMAGQIIYVHKLNKVLNTTFHYKRSGAVKSGLYLLKVINATSGEVSVYKVVFQ